MLHDGNSGLIGSRYILVVGGLHLELLHALLGLGDVDTVAGRIVAAHSHSLLFLFGKRSLPGGCEVLSVGVFCPEAQSV